MRGIFHGAARIGAGSRLALREARLVDQVRSRRGPGTLRLAAALVVGLSCIAGPAAIGQEAVGGRSVVEVAQDLKPGEFLWAPEIVPEGPMLLIVSVASQRAILYRNGVPIAVTTVSTGREGYETPLGIFTVLQKHARHFSSIYDNAPMPFMQRLTWGGVALHGGQLPGYPASHGCIRLPQGFARLLFGVTGLGMTVIVTDRIAIPRVAPTAEVLGPARDAPAGGTEWHPERAPAGPVSIVLSGADRRVVVLRNGREIGSAPVSIRGKVEGTTAYILRTADASGHHWFTVALPGQAPSEAPVEDLGNRFGADADFRAQVAEIVAPGTTVIVTADTLRAAAGPVPLIEAEPDR